MFEIGILVSSKRTLQDFEVVDYRDDIGILYVKEVDVSNECARSKRVSEDIIRIHVSDVEPLFHFYNRMH